MSAWRSKRHDPSLNQVSILFELNELWTTENIPLSAHSLFFHYFSIKFFFFWLLIQPRHSIFCFQYRRRLRHKISEHPVLSSFPKMPNHFTVFLHNINFLFSNTFYYILFISHIPFARWNISVKIGCLLSVTTAEFVLFELSIAQCAMQRNSLSLQTIISNNIPSKQLLVLLIHCAIYTVATSYFLFVLLNRIQIELPSSISITWYWTYRYTIFVDDDKWS